MSRVKVAVVGSGPSGFYAVSALLKQCGECEIDIIERLPTPFGLIRAGVAPDHQTTKNVVRAYSKTACEAGVSYFGNVSVGRDVSLAELREIYDAVILAVGAPAEGPGLYIATMHSGITLGPVIGRLAAEEILDGQNAALLDPYRPGRFN